MIFLQGASSSQYNSQPAQPFSSSAGEYFPDFFARQAQHPPSVQAVGQIQVLGVPSVHTQTAAPPVDSVATNWNPGFEGLVGEETWFTGVAHSPVPAIPPVRFVGRVLQSLLILNDTARPAFVSA